MMPIIHHSFHVVTNAYLLYSIDANFFVQQILLVPILFIVMSKLAFRVMAGPRMKLEIIMSEMRFLLGRVVRHTESIALFRGGRSELQHFESVHAVLHRTKVELNLKGACMAVVNNVCSSGLAILPGIGLVRGILAGTTTVAAALLVYDRMNAFRDSCFYFLELPEKMIEIGVPASRLGQLFKEADYLESEAA